MKKKFLLMFAILLATCLMLTISVKADNNGKLPNESGNTITLTENVTLTSEHKVESGNHTIDLQGHTITATNGYAINVASGATLTIKDSSSGKTGKIIHTTGEQSCIRNEGTLTLEGIKAESNFVAVKNEKDAKMTINNSTITSSYAEAKTAAVLNYGTGTITGSTIESTGANGVAISGILDTTDTKSTLTVTGSTIKANWLAISTSKKDKVTVDGGKIEGPLPAQSGLDQIDIKGNVEGPMNAVRYAVSGAKVTLNEDNVNIKNDVYVNEGVTLVIPEGKKVSVDKAGSLTVTGTVNGKVGSAVLNETKGTYYGSVEKALINTVKDKENKLVLQNNVEETEFQFKAAKEANALVNTKNVEIDLNGYTLKTTLENGAEATMKIVDGSKAKTGKVDGKVTNKGTLTINNGKFTQMPVTAEGATTTLNGGTYPIEDIQNAVIPEGKELVKNADGTYSIRSIVPEADEEKDPTPNTGVDVYAIAGAILVVSALGTVVLNKRK